MKTSLKISTLPLAFLLMSFAPGQPASSSNVSEIPASLKTSIKWKSTEIELGEIVQNKPVAIEFEFTNVGESPVIISNVQASCGCTSTNFSKTPVLPGETTKITATFNAAVKGVFKKQVTVITNADEHPKTLTFTGIVI
jgi:hypothetical protein